MKREVILAMVLLGLTVVAEENQSQNRDFKPIQLGDQNASSEFKKFLASDSKSVWKKIGWMNKPEGIIEVREGKLFMQSKGAPFTGIYLPIPKAYALKVAKGDKIRFTVIAQGSGRIGYWAYGPDGKYFGKACTGSWINQKEIKKLSFEFTVAEGVAKITPYITASKTGITIESVQIETFR